MSQEVNPPSYGPMRIPQGSLARGPGPATTKPVAETDRTEGLEGEPVIKVFPSPPEERTHVSVAYHVENAISLPSSPAGRRVAIAAVGFDADLKRIRVPRKSTLVSIEAHIKNTSQYELLPGPAGVFMDGGYVTKASLGVSIYARVSHFGRIVTFEPIAC